MGRRETNDKVQPKHKPKLEKKISLLALDCEDMFRVSARVELESASLQKPHQTITFLQKLSYFTYQKIPSKHHIRNFHYANPISRKFQIQIKPKYMTLIK